MKCVRISLAVGAFVLACIVAASAQTRGEAVVDGIVKDDTGTPVSDVSIAFLTGNGNTVQGKSDAGGRWRVVGLGKGEWRVLFTAKGYVTQATKVLIRSEDAASILVPIVLRKAIEQPTPAPAP
jgi:hypothetical protein